MKFFILVLLPLTFSNTVLEYFLWFVELFQTVVTRTEARIICDQISVKDV